MQSQDPGRFFNPEIRIPGFRDCQDQCYFHCNVTCSDNSNSAARHLVNEEAPQEVAALQQLQASRTRRAAVTGGWFNDTLEREGDTAGCACRTGKVHAYSAADVSRFT